jgi:hypothetical protein
VIVSDKTNHKIQEMIDIQAIEVQEIQAIGVQDILIIKIHAQTEMITNPKDPIRANF